MSRDQSNVETAAAAVNGQAPAALSGAVAQALAEHDQSVAEALRLLSRMEREGTLKELADLLALVKLLKEAMTDDMVVGLVRRIDGLAAVATDPSVTALASRLPKAVRAAEADAAEAAAQPPGVMALIKQLGDPQVRRGLVFFLSLAKHLAAEPE